MVAKRKTVSTITKGLKVAGKDVIASQESDEETDQQIVPVEHKEPSESELALARTKELKAMSAEDMKALMASNGLETGKKEDMIKNLLKHEAKLRKIAKDEKAKIRAVVVQKKEELEGMSMPELSKLCESIGLKGIKSKPERVQRLLVHWQENDGVEKALSDAARKERVNELNEMDVGQLQKLCTKSGVDPYVKEIMVDRISKHEFDAGVYSRPTIVQETEATKEVNKGNFIDAVLANEAQRKKVQELQAKKEEAAQAKLRDLKALSIKDLEKRIAKKGLEATGKKDDMIKLLLSAMLEEDVVAERKAGLRGNSLPELKDILTRNGLDAVNGKEQMISAILAFESKRKEDLKVFESRIVEVVDKQKQALESKSNAALKEMCASKGLAVGGSKEERIERIAGSLREDPALDHTVSSELRTKRKEEILKLDKTEVVKLCDQMNVQPFVKDVIVERLISYESESNDVIAMSDLEPAAKKARTSKR